MLGFLPFHVPAGLREQLPEPQAVASSTNEILPAAAGAYLLLLRLDRPADVDIRAVGRHRLPSGWYAYAGSARGPGGLKARIGRHLRSGKPVHWHIDRLTPAAAALIGLAYPDGEECALIAALMGGGTFAVPMEGFGSSDCRVCRSHLLRWTGSDAPKR